MKKLFVIIAIILFNVFQSYGQALPIKEILMDGQQYHAILDTTGISKQNDIDTLIGEIKKLNCVKEVILVSTKDSNNASLKNKLSSQNIIIAGLFIKNNFIWKALNGGVYSITKERFGSIPPNAGLKCIGDNPNGKGFSVVFTSNSITGIKAILSFKEDEKSFYAVLNNKIAESLLLNNRFGLEKDIDLILTESKRIELAKALEDVDYFFSTIQSAHPQPLKNIFPDDYLALKKKIADTLTILDQRKDLTVSDLTILLAEAAEKFKDGHTSLLPEIKNPKLVKMPPFRVEYKNGKINIGNAVKDAAAYSGYEIQKINQKTPEEFFTSIFSIISGEKNIFKWSRFIRNQDKYLAVKNIFNVEDIVLSLKDKEENISEIHVKPIDITEFQSIPKEKEKIIYNNFSFLSGGKVALFQYNSFDLSAKEKALVDSLFKMMNINKTTDLIIDLRNNGGGNSNMGDYIISYLTAKPYCMFSRVDVKLSKELLAEGAYKEYKELEGMTITDPSDLTQPENKINRFSGNTIVLTSNNTFSSAADFAAVIKDFSLGTLIGSETGGMRQCFGDVLGFNTPNYNISFGVSHKIFFAPVPKPDDEYHGTVPDVQITEEMLKEYANSTDPILDFTLHYIFNK